MELVPEIHEGDLCPYRVHISAPAPGADEVSDSRAGLAGRGAQEIETSIEADPSRVAQRLGAWLVEENA